MQRWYSLMSNYFDCLLVVVIVIFLTAWDSSVLRHCEYPALKTYTTYRQKFVREQAKEENWGGVAVDKAGSPGNDL